MRQQHIARSRTAPANVGSHWPDWLNWRQPPHPPPFVVFLYCPSGSAVKEVSEDSEEDGEIHA